MEKAAKYVKENKGMGKSMPFICGGDFNSMPVSSVLSAIYGEDIEETSDLKPSTWQLPASLS